MEKLGWLPTRSRRSITHAVEAAQRALGSELVAAAVVGAAASPARADRARGPQILVVAKSLEPAKLRSLAEHAHAAMRDGVRLRALTARELERSTDVFALEVSEWRDRHVLLHGEDPFAKCVVSRGDLVRSLEAAARGLVRKLRNRVLADLGTDGRRDVAGEAVGDAVERSLVIAHHFLALDGEPPADEVALLTAVSDAAGADPRAILPVLEQLRRTGRVTGPVERAEALLPWLEKLVDRVDALGDP